LKEAKSESDIFNNTPRNNLNIRARSAHNSP